MENLLDEYNIGIIEAIKEGKAIIKPLVVIDNTGYNTFEVDMDKDILSYYKSELDKAYETLIVPYDSYKKIIVTD